MGQPYNPFEFMKGIIYTRVSGDEQVKGTSLEFQEEVCRKYCEQKGIEIIEIFREKGETAKDLSLNNRQQFLKALEFCRKNKNQIQTFVVLRVDRFARNTEDHFAVRKILLGYGTTLHSVTEPIGNKPAEKFIETVLAGAAEYDNTIRKQRCSDGMSTKINQDIYPWRPPLGYKCAHFKKRGEKKTEPDKPDEEIFPIIQRALKEYSKGIYSQMELVRLLDKWGLKSIRGKKTTPQLVDRILGRYLKFYAGVLENPWTGEDRDGLHTAMITKDELYRIQLIRAGKAHAVKRIKYNPEFPLRKTVMCGACGRPLTGSRSRGNGGAYSYYHCHNKNCSQYGKGTGKENLEREFLQCLKKITPKEEFLGVFSKTVLDLWQNQGKSSESEVKKYEHQLTMLEARRKRIFEMREEGSYTREEFQERKEEIENEIASVKISLSESKIDQFDIEGALTYATNFIRNVSRQWFDLSPQFRPRFQKLIFPEGILYQREKGFGTAKLGIIFELNQHFDGEKSQVVDSLRISWNQIIEELMVWQQLQADIKLALTA
ncbi:MAG: recombinase family protein [Ignavibacteriales bacterium]